LFSYGCIQIVMKPTRCTPTTATLLDHLITNHRTNLCETVILTSKISDHYPFIYEYDEFMDRKTDPYSFYRDFSDNNVNLFSNSLYAINWDFLNAFDTQESYDHFSDTFFSLYNLYFPLIKSKINKKIHKINPWMSKGILISRFKKIELCKLSVRHQSEPHLSNYKCYRNLYNKVIKLSKKLYFEKELKKYQSDAKKNMGNFTQSS
jgi:hypothetical protein